MYDNKYSYYNEKPINFYSEPMFDSQGFSPANYEKEQKIKEEAGTKEWEGFFKKLDLKKILKDAFKDVEIDQGLDFSKIVIPEGVETANPPKTTFAIEIWKKALEKNVIEKFIIKPKELNSEDSIAATSARKHFEFIFELLHPYRQQFAISGGSVVREFFKSYHKQDFTNYDSDTVPEIDIFPATESAFNDINSLLTVSVGYQAGKDGKEVRKNSTIFHFKDYSIDLIKVTPKERKHHGDTDYVANLRQFDILPCAVMLCDKELLYLDDALEMIKNKTLAMNSIGNLSNSVRRMAKYANRGFEIRGGHLANYICLCQKLFARGKEKDIDFTKFTQEQYDHLFKCSENIVLDDLQVYNSSYGENTDFKEKVVENNTYKFLDID